MPESHRGLVLDGEVGDHRAHGRLVDQRLLEGAAARRSGSHCLGQRHAHDADRAGDGAQARVVDHVDDHLHALAFLVAQDSA